MPNAITEDQIEARARALYEARRMTVSGRPSWDLLNHNDPYDMGMKNAAVELARKGADASIEEKAKALFAHMGGNANKYAVGIGSDCLHVYVYGKWPVRDRFDEWQGVGVFWSVNVGSPKAIGAA
ncbi:hypothetical protein ABNQ39_20415 [Azospirillum sp. A26]|uniref:hypothetical protein n=1 Tax=Azospirillum sp. A26 TaxID=3160607 RepID=UPI00366C01A2